MSRLLLDAGALIALERDQRPMWRRFELATLRGGLILTHGGVLGQVWRHPSRQARLVMALRSVRIVPLDADLGRRAGLLLAACGASDVTDVTDVMDAAVVALSRAGDIIVTSDPDDLAALARVHDARGVAIVPA